MRDFILTASISNQTYEAKPLKVDYSNMKFKKRTFYSIDEFINTLNQGHSLTSNFRTNNDKVFDIREKTEDKFDYSQIVVIDIDDENNPYKNIEEFVARLTYKPTFGSYSFSDPLVKDRYRKFHLYYCFNQGLGVHAFDVISKFIVSKSEEETGVRVDKKSLSKSQLWNNPKAKIEDIIRYDLIYNVESFYADALCFNVAETTKPIKKSDDKILSDNSHWSKRLSNITYNKALINDIDMPFEQFKKKYHKMRRYNRVETKDWLTLKDGSKYQYVDSNYFKIPYKVIPFKDGEGRKNQIYIRACLRRIINPSITFDELIFNALWDRERMDNRDGQVNKSTIIVKCLSAFEKSMDYILEQFKNSVQYLQNLTTPKSGIIVAYGQHHSKVRKQKNLELFAELFDPSKTNRENLEYMKENGLDISDETMNKYCKDLGLKKEKKNNKQEILGLIDFNLSVRANLRTINEMGYKISRGSLHNLMRNIT